MPSVVANYIEEFTQGFHRLAKSFLKPVLRPFYNLGYRILIRMLTQADEKTQHESYPLRRLITHPTRQHPLVFDPARCLQPFSSEELTSVAREAARKRLGIPPDQHVVVSLGMITHNKGPLACMSALEQLRYWRVPSHLYFLGAVHPDIISTIEETIDELGLSEQVHRWDQPEDGESCRDLLIAADCAIQIQTHLPGTFSGALLDCLSAGLPTICNAHLATVMNTPSFVRTIPDELSPLLLAERILDLYNHLESHRRDNTHRLRNVAEHNATNYSPQILKLLLAS